MTEPARTRPRLPADYGISEAGKGMLVWEWAVERLVSARTYWIGTTKPSGAPHAAPVWGLWADGAVLFSTSPDSRKGRNLLRDSRVTIHLESGEEVVVLEGEVERVELRDELADAYEAKYGFRPTPRTGLWFRVAPRVAWAWIEADYPRTATRFDFVRRGAAAS